LLPKDEETSKNDQAPGIDLELIAVPPVEISVSSPPGLATAKDEFSAYERRQSLRRRDLTNTDYENDIRSRKHFAWGIFGLMCFWLTCVLAIVVLTGLKVLTLDKTVLITLVTSGSVNVIGVFNHVAKHLFRNSSADLKDALPQSTMGKATE
jgi:hypothetical protein